MARRRWVATCLAIAALSALSQWLGRASGSTSHERRRQLPGDELVPRPTLVTNHARTLAASPEQVWPWLTQVGWHRGGWYTPRWVDRVFFPQNTPSADTIEPRLQRALTRGDTIPDGPPGTAQFVVAEVEPPHLLVLRSATHIPTAWRERYGATIDWVWTFSLMRDDFGGTRMLVRNRADVSPWWLRLGYLVVLVPADHVMATGMLRGLDHRTVRVLERERLVGQR